jgi:DNA-binding LytR/AlgR family response regulator
MNLLSEEFRSLTSDKKIRILIIDDEPLARKRIRRLLDEDPDFEIFGPAKFVRISPHALVSDQAIQRIQHGETKQLALILHNGMKLEVSSSYAKKVGRQLHP